MEIGIDSFAAASNQGNGTAADSSKAITQLLDRMEQADKAGLDVFGIGEHHRKEFLDSAPALILSAAAARTKNIRLTSAVTVLSAADPVSTPAIPLTRATARFATSAYWTVDFVSADDSTPSLVATGRGASLSGRFTATLILLFRAFCSERL